MHDWRPTHQPIKPTVSFAFLWCCRIRPLCLIPRTPVNQIRPLPFLSLQMGISVLNRIFKDIAGGHWSVNRKGKACCNRRINTGISGVKLSLGYKAPPGIKLEKVSNETVRLFGQLKIGRFVHLTHDFSQSLAQWLVVYGLDSCYEILLAFWLLWRRLYKTLAHRKAGPVRQESVITSSSQSGALFEFQREDPWDLTWTLFHSKSLSL